MVKQQDRQVFWQVRVGSWKYQQISKSEETTKNKTR